MSCKSFSNILVNFLNNRAGDFAMQGALMFAALAVVGALLAAPMLDKASREYAENQSYGIDPITTSSVRKTSQNGNIITIRRSILSNKEVIICKTPKGKVC